MAFVLSASAQLSFQDQAVISGINITAGDTFLGNGITLFDFDKDGWDDITITSADTMPIRFYKNVSGNFVEQDFGFTTLTYETKSVTWVDIDNDGDNDLFITSATSGNKLFLNDGSMTFTDITDSAGLPSSNLYTYGASWGDYNNDGYLDVFVNNRTGIVPNKLYKNNGNLTFSDVSFQAGIDLSAAFSFCSAFLDINNDGFQDLYVSNDKLSYRNKLYRNNGDGTFTDISESSGTDVLIDAMSVTVGDYNSDGYFDIYVTNNPEGNVLLRNNGDETFTDVAAPTGTIYNSIGWGAAFFDADNDTDLDLYVSGSQDGSVPEFLSAAFYESNNGVDFTLNNAVVPGDDGSSYSNAVGDINNDGLLDFVVSNNNENINLWKNTSTLTNNWIKLNLVGIISNKGGVGSKIEMSINGQSQYRYTFCGDGYMSQSSGTTHFGVGAATTIDYLKVNWPSGTEDIYYNVNVNQVLTIEEGLTLGIDSNESLENMYISPNPVISTVDIISSHQFNRVEVYTLLGQKLISLEILDNTVDMSNLQPGSYIIQCVSPTQVMTKKLIKL